MITYGVKMITSVSDRLYELGVEGQGQIYIIADCLDVLLIPIPFWRRIFIFDTISRCVTTRKLLDSMYGL